MLCAIVVLYNYKGDSLMNNIKEYYDAVDKIILVDNSDEKSYDDQEVLTLEKVLYYKLGYNAGIAYALAFGMEKAKELGSDYVLTMDQDSRFAEGTFKNLSSYLLEKKENVALIAPNIRLLGRETKHTNSIEELDMVITSGSIIDMKAYEAVDGFDERLFIDCVDFDLCRQFKEKGFSIIRVNTAIILHELGESRFKKFLTKKIIVSTHSPMRYYYYSRNWHICKNKTAYAKSYFSSMKKDKLKMYIKMFLFEKNRIKKIAMIRKGKKDAKNFI